MTTSRPNVLLAATLMPYLVQRLRDNFSCHDLQTLTPQALAQVAPNIRAIACRGESKITREFIAQFPALELVSVFGVGYDGIDVIAARERGVQVTHTPDVLNDDVADLAMALVLASGRQIVHADGYARGGAWKNGPHALTTKVSGARLGIVGLGRIGKAIARRAAGFDMEISYHNRAPRDDVDFRYFGELKALAAHVDFLVVITPGGAGTRALINADILEALGPEGFLINVSRGSVVDEEALIAALRQGKIAGAGLDVFANEPHVPPALAALDNVVLTPHMASGTMQTRGAMADLVCDNLSDHFAGKPLRTPVPQ